MHTSDACHISLYFIRSRTLARARAHVHPVYTQSPLQDSRLFGPRPWKILATTYKQMGS